MTGSFGVATQASVGTPPRRVTYTPSSQVPKKSPARVLGDLYGQKESVGAQRLKLTDPRCIWSRVAEEAAALIAAGHADVVERLCLALDLVRKHVKPRLSVDLIAEADKADIMEDLAENEARAFPSQESNKRWLRALKLERLEEGNLIAALEVAVAE